MKHTLYTILFLAFCSCNKIDNWLDVKSKNSDVILRDVSDYQSLLDNTSIMNTTPAIGIISGDNLGLVESTALTGGNISERNAYIWQEDIYEGLVGAGTTDWVAPFMAITYANVVLEGIEKGLPFGAERDNVWGSALFFRAFHYFQLLQVYAPPYEKGAGQRCAIPVRTRSDVNDKGTYVSVEELYQRVIDDLVASLELLPDIPVQKTRPSRIAALGMLSKVYMSMAVYVEALRYADEFLKKQNNLLNFGSLDVSAALPFPTMAIGHPEIAFYAYPISYLFTSYGGIRVDESLFSEYATHDIRKTAYFKENADGTKSFKGRYTGTVGLFSGIAVDEIWLNKAECLARIGETQQAQDMINEFSRNRYRNFIEPTEETSETVLDRILDERRKELVFTGHCRWEDLRRLNKEPRFAKTLYRTLAGKTYTLPPNDPRYTFPVIPAEVNLNK